MLTEAFLVILGLHKQHGLGGEPQVLEALPQRAAFEYSPRVGRCQAVL